MHHERLFLVLKSNQAGKVPNSIFTGGLLSDWIHATPFPNAHHISQFINTLVLLNKDYLFL